VRRPARLLARAGRLGALRLGPRPAVHLRLGPWPGAALLASAPRFRCRLPLTLISHPSPRFGASVAAGTWPEPLGAQLSISRLKTAAGVPAPCPRLGLVGAGWMVTTEASGGNQPMLREILSRAGASVGGLAGSLPGVALLSSSATMLTSCPGALDERWISRSCWSMSMRGRPLLAAVVYVLGALTPWAHQLVLDGPQCERCTRAGPETSGACREAPRAPERMQLQHRHAVHDQDECTACQLGYAPVLSERESSLPAGISGGACVLWHCLSDVPLARVADESHLARAPPAAA